MPTIYTKEWYEGADLPEKRSRLYKLEEQGFDPVVHDITDEQEIVQKKHKTPPEYKMVKTTGPDHDKTFAVKVQFGARVLGSGHGKSKKEAEQAAAKDALERIEKE